MCILAYLIVAFHYLQQFSNHYYSCVCGREIPIVYSHSYLLSNYVRKLAIYTCKLMLQYHIEKYQYRSILYHSENPGIAHHYNQSPKPIRVQPLDVLYMHT